MTHKERKSNEYRSWLLILTYIAAAISGTGFLLLCHPSRFRLTETEIFALRLIAPLPLILVSKEWLRLVLSKIFLQESSNK